MDLRTESVIDPQARKRESTYLFLAGIFITSLVMGNIIGTTKFVTLFAWELPSWLLSITPDLVHNAGIYKMIVPVGVLVYPVTFLATDLLSELYGAERTQKVVWTGFFMNFFMLAGMSVGHFLPDASGISGASNTFESVYAFMIGNTLASMVAYLTAQSIDVKLFHFWKRLTGGKYLWLRNNGSTMVSQLIDSIAILSILYIAGNLGESVNGLGALIILIINSYLFKFLFALIDTPFFYGLTYFFERYLTLEKNNSVALKN